MSTPYSEKYPHLCQFYNLAVLHTDDTSHHNMRDEFFVLALHRVPGNVQQQRGTWERWELELARLTPLQRCALVTWRIEGAESTAGQIALKLQTRGVFMGLDCWLDDNQLA